MAIIQYIVNSPERWDNIAAKAYGNPGMIEPIVKANPNVLIIAVIPAGTVLDIPIFEDDQVQTSEDLLPPWMK
jgi:hypothetical protein